MSDYGYSFVDDEEDDDVPQITQKQARECLTLVQEWVDRTLGKGWEARLYDPGFHADAWTIALECDADCWPFQITDRGNVLWPRGVFVEPLNHWALSLHPA